MRGARGWRAQLREVLLGKDAIGPAPGILELERAPIVFGRGAGLVEDQRAAATTPQLVLGEVRGDDEDPGRELAVVVEAMDMARHAHEGFLHEVLRPLPITNDAPDEIVQAVMVATNKFTERTRIAIEVTCDEPLVSMGPSGRKYGSFVRGVPDVEGEGAVSVSGAGHDMEHLHSRR